MGAYKTRCLGQWEIFQEPVPTLRR